MTVHRCANCACSTRFRTATHGLGRSNRCVAFFTPPDRGARLRPVVFTALEFFSIDSNAKLRDAGTSAFAAARCGWLGTFAAAGWRLPSVLPAPLVLALPLLLLLLVYGRATCTGWVVCLQDCLRSV